MNKFECACGHSFNDKNNGEVQRLLIQRIYEPSSEQKDFHMEDRCRTCKEEKLIRNINLYNIKTGKLYTAEDTYCLAKNIEFKFGNLVDYYDYEPSAEQSVELVFQINEWRKAITKSKKTHNYSLLDIIDLVVEEIWEEISEENDYEYGELHMTSSDGDYTTISIESEDHLKDSIISARIVGYKQTEG